MAKHKHRNGTLVVLYECKQGRHGAACDEMTAMFEKISGADDAAMSVCHCACHEPCTRPACLKPRAQRRANKVCPGCGVVLPLTGVCDSC